MNKKIVILSGGFSEEKEVSKVSAAEIEKELKNRGYETVLMDPVDHGTYSNLVKKISEINPEIVFIGLHGAEGEDGRIQAILDLHGIPFTGSGHRASAVAMDKSLSAGLANSIGITIPARLTFKQQPTDLKAISEKIGFPCVVKPNDSGSSVGISMVSRPEDISAAFKDAFNFSEIVLCEKFIPGRELTVTVLDDKALPVVEIIPREGWYDYSNKYTKGSTVYDTPAKLRGQETELLQGKALKIFKLFGCKVYARVDFRYDGKVFYFLELNTLPGMTPLSLTPMAAKAAGLDFGEFLEKIIYYSLN